MSVKGVFIPENEIKLIKLRLEQYQEELYDLHEKYRLGRKLEYSDFHDGFKYLLQEIKKAIE